MTNPITNDGILTQRPVPERRSETQADGARTDTADRAPADADPSVGRAQQRLSQEVAASGPHVLSTPDQARELAAAVREQIAASPQAALQAA